jgi:hypothetical protein
MFAFMEAVMKHQFPREFDNAAELPPAGHMTRAERLKRWADLLDRHRGQIQALDRIEYLTGRERRAVRGARTPMAVAFADPILRDQGLTGDTLGETMDFFGLSDDDAHRLFCDCHYHGTMSSSGLSHRLRAEARPPFVGSLWQRARSLFMS